MGTAFVFACWMAMVLLNVWKVTMVELVIYACILGTVSSLIYAAMLVHRKFYY